MNGDKKRRDKNDAIKAAFVENVRQGNTLAKSAELVGVSRQTLYRWFDEDAAFDHAVEKAKVARMRILEESMYSTAVSGSVPMLIFLACNWAPDKYRNTQYVDASIKPGVGVQKFTPAELARIAAGEKPALVLKGRKTFDGQ